MLKVRKALDSSGRVVIAELRPDGTERRIVADTPSEWNRARQIDPYASAPPPPSADVWRAPGSIPLADGDAAAKVVPTRENRPENTAANGYRPTLVEIQAFRSARDVRYGRTMLDFNPLLAHVTGGFAGTTDEIFQWVAVKWGIPSDVVRAVAVNESSWRQAQQGDRRAVADPSIYPAHSRVAGSRDVFESLGILQVKWNPDTHWGTEPLRWRSTAFCADYWAATVRYYFDGLCDWCSPGYGPGQGWNSVGAWFNPSPWASSLNYVTSAQQHKDAKPWRSY